MCGRFGGSFDAKDLVDRFSLFSEPPHFHSSYNIAPSFTIPVITRNSPNKAILMRWGFIPTWADPTKFKIKPINARDDQLFVSNFYKEAINNFRCIIPFSFFYEWKRYSLDGKEQKEPYLIKVKNEKIMGFAGIYSVRPDAEGVPYYTCAIITTKPNSLMSKIHNRMPVILQKPDEDIWFSKDTDIAKIKLLLKPFESEKMEAYRVSELVNSPRNDSEELIKPI